MKKLLMHIVIVLGVLFGASVAHAEPPPPIGTNGYVMTDNSVKYWYASPVGHGYDCVTIAGGNQTTYQWCLTQICTNYPPGNAMCGSQTGNWMYITLAAYTGSPTTDPNWDPVPAPDKSLGSNENTKGTPNICCGNPINTGTGNKFQTESDYAGTDLLKFVRYYNSAPTAPTNLLGSHWTNTYTRRVDYLASAPSVAVLRRPDGSGFTYNLISGIWTADADVVAKLVQLNDANGVLQGWEYQEQDGRQVEDYDARGRLIGINRTDGQSVVLVYNNGLTENNDNDFLLTSVTAQDGRSLAFSYNSLRRLSQLTDPTGAVYGYSYDAFGRLISVSYPGGAGKTYVYNESTYTAGADISTALTGIIDEKSQRFAIFNYATDGRAVSTEHAGGAQKFAMVYNADGTTSVTTPAGAVQQRAFVTLNGVRRISSISVLADGATHASTYSYDSNGRADIVTDKAGVTTDYDYNSRGLLTQEIDSANNAATRRTTQITWDTTLREPTDQYVYDSSVSSPGTLKSRSRWTYNSRGQVLAAMTVDTANGANVRTTAYTYCEQADVTAGTCPLVGLLTLVNGPRVGVSDNTWLTYYASDDATCASAPTTCPHRKGDLFTISQTATNPVSHVVTTLTTTYLKYDGAGRPLAVQDANGVVTNFTYSARGWLTQVIVRGIDPNSSTDDAVTTLGYDLTGKLTKVTQPDGDYLSYTYDVAHRLTKVTDNLGDTVNYTLDAVGNRTREDTKDPSAVLKRTQSRVFNQLGRIQKTLNAASQATLITYDANDNVDLVSDPLNHTTNQDVDALNRPTQVTEDVGGLNVLTKFQYDARDDLTQATDPKGLTTTYTRDGLNDLVSVASPDTGTTTYTYDSAGNRATQKDAKGITTTYAYDELNRLTNVIYPTTALNVTYLYDTVNAICGTGESYAKGHLTQFIDSTGNTQFCYDRFGNLTRKQQIYSTFTQTTLFEYTLGGRLLSVTYPSGSKVNYGRNTNGQITSVQLTKVNGTVVPLIVGVGYYPFGPIQQIHFVKSDGSDLRWLTTYYDQDYAIDNITDAATGGLNINSTVDAVGNVVSQVSTLNGAPTTRNYSYDGLNRVTLATTPGATSLDERFSYDGTGDRLSKKIGASALQSYVYPSTSHELTSVAGAARTYDFDGSALTFTTGASVKTFTYDDRERVAESKIAGVVFRDYKYNARGERIARIDPSGVAGDLHYVYDEAGHLVGEYGAGGAALREYVWMGDTLVGVIATSEGSTSGYDLVETDQLGTPRAVIDPIRNVAIWRWSATGSTFGDHAPDADADGNGTTWWFQLRFPGQYDDGSSMPVYNYLRDYEAGTGRYAESDPMGLRGGISTYGYVGGGPLGATDRFGLEAEYNFHDLYGDVVGIGLDAWGLSGMGLALNIASGVAGAATANAGRYLVEAGMGEKAAGTVLGGGGAKYLGGFAGEVLKDYLENGEVSSESLSRAAVHTSVDVLVDMTVGEVPVVGWVAAPFVSSVVNKDIDVLSNLGIGDFCQGERAEMEREGVYIAPDYSNSTGAISGFRNALVR
jgi:RHS repeat-associated protein